MALLPLSPATRLFQMHLKGFTGLRIIPSASYAKKIGFSDGGKTKTKLGGPVMTKKRLPVETDPHRLANYVCGTNLLKEGGEDIKIKSDSEYPDWIWKMKLDGPPSLEDLDPNTLEYWKRLKHYAQKRISIDHRLKRL
ncbi:hypothetical protein CHUAL_009033 [Chamberlinius hualienensis]